MYAHLRLRDRLRIPIVTARCRSVKPRAGETFGALLRRLGASDVAVERFWDVFIRPALNLRADEATRHFANMRVAASHAMPSTKPRPLPFV